MVPGHGHFDSRRTSASHEVEDCQHVKVAELSQPAGQDCEELNSRVIRQRRAARAAIAFGVPAIVVWDVRLPGVSGTEWLTEVGKIDPEIPVVLVTGHGRIAMAVQAMREGAYDFLEKPFTSERLIPIVRHAVERRQLALQVRALRDALDNWHGIQAVLIGRSAQMQQIRRTVMTLAGTSADVLIYGETGTGKELVARCLHDHSERRR